MNSSWKVAECGDPRPCALHGTIAPGQPIPGEAFDKGFKQAVAYWSAAPNRIDMTARKRAWLTSQTEEFRAGWAAGAATVE